MPRGERVRFGVVGPTTLASPPVTWMNRWFNKKRKKLPKPPQQLGITTNAVAGPGSLAGMDINPEGGRSHPCQDLVKLIKLILLRCQARGTAGDHILHSGRGVVAVRTFLCRKYQHLMLSILVLDTETILSVSAPNPCDLVWLPLNVYKLQRKFGGTLFLGVPQSPSITRLRPQMDLVLSKLF